MDRQNPFQRHQYFSPGYQTSPPQVYKPTSDRHPTNNPFNRDPRTNHRPAYERERSEDVQYSAAHHPYIELQPVGRQRSNDAQFQASPQRPTYSRQSTTLHNSTEQFYTADQGYTSEQQDSSTPTMGQQSSTTRGISQAPPPAGSLYLPTDHEIFEAMYPPSSWVGPVVPRHPIPFPIPRMRDYQNFNDSFHKFIIKGSRPRLIERLNTVAAVDAKTRGYFSDTGLVSTESIAQDFGAAEYILFCCDHLVEPSMFNRQRIFPSTFGVMGEDLRTGQWHVRCWIQPSNRVSREIQLMVREKLVLVDNVVKKDEGPRGRGLDGHMRMQEHEQIWTLIHGWDWEMRTKWSESFRTEGGGPTRLVEEPIYELKGKDGRHRHRKGGEESKKGREQYT